MSMLTFRPTVALAKRIGAQLPVATEPMQAPHADWCAHVFTAQRFRYVILTNTYSLLSVVMSAKGMNDENEFIRSSLSSIREYLRDSGREFALERFVGPAAGEVQFARLSDRAVLGSINELVFLAKCELIEGGLSSFETSHRLNEVPMSVLWKRGAGGHPGAAFDQMPRHLRQTAPDDSYRD